MNTSRFQSIAALRQVAAWGALAVLSALMVGEATALATTPQLAGQSIPLLEGIEIEQHLEAHLPSDATFRDQSGQTLSFGSLFGELPVVLTLNYVDCPMLCTVQLGELTSALALMDLSIGTDYRVVTISIDPKDTPEKAAGMRTRYLTQYGVQSEDATQARPAVAGEADWTVLVGDKFNIDRITETAGFPYRWIPEEQEYAHQAATILCSPDGKIMRYLPGIGPEMARELELSIVEAGDGRVGSLWDRAFLNCLVFDPSTGRYSLAAIRLLKVAAVLTVLAVVTGFFFMQRGRAHQQLKTAGAEEGDTPS